jgi:predicted HTH domain antitoxin
MTNTLTIPYPDSLPSALRMSRREFEEEARLLLAARLFEEKRITSGQAAEMVGLSRSDFLQKTASLKLTAAMPSAEELAEEIHLGKAHACINFPSV